MADDRYNPDSGEDKYGLGEQLFGTSSTPSLNKTNNIKQKQLVTNTVTKDNITYVHNNQTNSNVITPKVTAPISAENFSKLPSDAQKTLRENYPYQIDSSSYSYLSSSKSSTNNSANASKSTKELQSEANDIFVINTEFTEEYIGGLLNPYPVTYVADVSDIEFSAGNRDALIQQMVIEQMNGVEAIPYQFLPTVDSRIVKGQGLSVSTENSMGRKFVEKIVARMPLLFLAPCMQQSLADFSKDDKRTVMATLMNGDNCSESELDDLVYGSGRYFTARLDYDYYYRYLNCMLAAVAGFMGIYDEEIPKYFGDNESGKTVKLGEYDWSNETNKAFKTYFSSKENLVFYLDGINTIDETFSNEITDSSIAGTINEVTSTGNEIKFLLSGMPELTQSLTKKAGEALTTITQTFTDLIGLGADGSVLGALANNGIQALISGGKIIFPKIWSGSEYSKSYSLNIKLRSPDHDPLSIYLNILKPYCKLLCLTLPRVLNTDNDTYDVNVYNNPFLVKAYCKGMFNIDMGIITSLSVTKGAESQWNDDGLPTQIDVTLQIEDLYSALAMSGFEPVGIFHPLRASNQLTRIVNNTAYMDFLANMAGLNICQEEMGRKTKMWNYLRRTATDQLPGRIGIQFDQKVSNFLSGLWRW
jgi:hypothetical protein